MSHIIYSCQGCRIYIFAEDETTNEGTEILWTDLNYCQSCIDAIDKHFPPGSHHTCIACMDQSKNLDAAGWYFNDELAGMCCPSCVAAEAKGYVLSDYYAIDLFTEQNAMEAYESHRQAMADSHDRAASDYYHGRDC